MPEGYFGPGDITTLFGWGFVAFEGLCLLAGVPLLLLGNRWGRRVGLFGAVMTAGAFIAPMAADPMVAGPMVGWALVILLRFVLAPTRSTLERDGKDDIDRFFQRNGPALLHLSGVALLATLAIVGYEASNHPLALTICALLHLLPVLASVKAGVALVRRGETAAVLLFVVLGVALALLPWPVRALAALAGFELLFMALLASRTRFVDDLMSSFLARPALFTVITFAVLVTIGTILLSFPAATADGQGLAPVDALFEATSAVCVTGLIVVDTPTAFSPFGLSVLLVMIQVGGLGIMVMASVGALALGKQLGLRHEAALGELLDRPGARSAYRLTVFIVTSTFVIELAGAVLLALGFLMRGYETGTAIWHGVFHSVSAFCNAGFALYSDSMIGFAEDPYILSVLMLLITFGGLGFAVIATLIDSVAERSRRISLHVKVVLLASMVLMLVGWVLYTLMEWDASLAGLSVTDKLINGLFQSVTLRTAGFNSVPYDGLEFATIQMMLVWMFIGASPGGTGGGAKTTTVVVLLGMLPSIARGESQVTFWRRSISQKVVYKAAGIMTMMMLVALICLYGLLATQDLSFESLVFETISAVGTVGLSVGATGELDTAGKLMIAVLMFFGRVGPLAIAASVGWQRPRKARWADEAVMVG